MLKVSLLVAALAMLAVVVPASAQLQVPDVGGAVGGVVNQPVLSDAQSVARDATQATTRELRNARSTAMRALQRANRTLIDTDRTGALIIRNEVVAIAPSDGALVAARARGFSTRDTIDASSLGLTLVVLTSPQGMSTRQALETLRQLDPEGAYDFNHLYFGAGPASSSPKQTSQRSGREGGGIRIGLIDFGVDASHPAFAGVALQQRGFSSPQAVADTHGTEVASLLAGADGAFHGAAPGASIYVADVYGGRPTGGGAAAIVAAMAWLAQSRATVINISLVGPPNRALEAVVRAALARGHVIVAAVGNDGPSAPPLYPASYLGVIGVTGVDARNRVLPEAGRGTQVDFAAPGSDMIAAAPSGGYAPVRGTSFAAPIVAGLIAQRITSPGSAAATRGEDELTRSAQDLGAHGPDQTFGAGLVGADVRNTPRQVARR